MDITRAIYDAENALREFLDQCFSKSIGEDWMVKSPVSTKFSALWLERKAQDKVFKENLRLNILFYYKINSLV